MKTVNEQLASSIVRHRQLAVGVENDIQRKLWAEVSKAEQAVLARLAEATAKPLNKKDITLLLADIKVDLVAAQDKVEQQLASQLSNVVRAEGQVTGRLLHAALPAVVADKAVLRKMPVRVVNDVLNMPVHGVTYKQAIANMFERLDKNISKTAQDAFGEAFHKELLAGKSFGVAKKTALNASGILSSKVGDVSKLFTKSARRDLRTIVHGHVQHSLDVAQTKVFQENSHLLQGVVFTATLDQKTCSVCAALDGTMYWMGKVPKGESGLLFADKPALPMHPGCRCCYVPIVKSWHDLPIEKVSKTDKKLLDGDIPRPKKYSDWFAEQSKSTQVDILGPTKYELWKSGQVKLTDMAVMDRSLTVTELKEASGAARMPKVVASPEEIEAAKKMDRKLGAMESPTDDKLDAMMRTIMKEFPEADEAGIRSTVDDLVKSLREGKTDVKVSLEHLPPAMADGTPWSIERLGSNELTNQMAKVVNEYVTKAATDPEGAQAALKSIRDTWHNRYVQLHAMGDEARVTLHDMTAMKVWNIRAYGCAGVENLADDALKEIASYAKKAKPKRLVIGNQKYAEWNQTLTKQEETALFDWTGGHFDVIRNVQLGRTEGMSESLMQRVKDEIKYIGQAIERAAPYEGTVYRGAGIKKSVLEEIRRTKSVQFTSFNSATSSPSVAEGFMNHAAERSTRTGYELVQFVIKNKSGVDIHRLSRYQLEKEVLLRPGARYLVENIVERVEDGKKFYEIFMKEVL